MKLKTAVVLAGGRGLRLRPYTENLPKPMIDLNGKPILHWIIDWLSRNNIEKIIIGVAHQKEKVIDWVEKNSFEVEIAISHHFVESGTAGGFKHAIHNAQIEDETFLGMNGDELTDLSLENFYLFHKRQNCTVTILATPLYSNFGVVNINSHNRITSFQEKSMVDGVFINSGIYIFEKRIYDYLPEEGNIEQTSFVRLSRENEMAAFRYYGFWKTINTEKDLEEAKKDIKILKT